MSKTIGATIALLSLLAVLLLGGASAVFASHTITIEDYDETAHECVNGGFKLEADWLEEGTHTYALEVEGEVVFTATLTVTLDEDGEVDTIVVVSTSADVTVIEKAPHEGAAISHISFCLDEPEPTPTPTPEVTPTPSPTPSPSVTPTPPPGEQFSVPGFELFCDGIEVGNFDAANVDYVAVTLDGDVVLEINVDGFYELEPGDYVAVGVFDGEVVTDEVEFTIEPCVDETPTPTPNAPTSTPTPVVPGTTLPPTDTAAVPAGPGPAAGLATVLLLLAFGGLGLMAYTARKRA